MPGDERSPADTGSGAESTATGPDPAASNTPADDGELIAWLRSQGCLDDAVVLAGHYEALPPPMSTPAGMGGLIVDMLALTADDNRVVVFTANWTPHPEIGDRGLDGQIYLTLSPTAEASDSAEPDTTVDVGLHLITIRGHQRLIKQWTGLGPDWPQVIAPTTADLMRTLQD